MLMKRKRKNIGVFVVVLILGLGAIGAILAYGAHVSANIHRRFVHERYHTAERLYRATVGQNILENHPQNPRELMEFYTDSFFLLHGDFIVCDDIFMEVIEFQRALFSPSLLTGTTAQQQFDRLKANLEALGEEGNMLLRRPVVDNIRHDFYDQRTALAYVIHPFMFHADLYRVYHLIMDDNDRWLINSWSLADADFNIIN